MNRRVNTAASGVIYASGHVNIMYTMALGVSKLVLALCQSFTRDVSDITSGCCCCGSWSHTWLTVTEAASREQRTATGCISTMVMRIEKLVLALSSCWNSQCSDAAVHAQHHCWNSLITISTEEVQHAMIRSSCSWGCHCCERLIACTLGQHQAVVWHSCSCTGSLL